MAQKSLIFLIAILSFVLALGDAGASSRGAIVGNWRPINNLKDPEVANVAEFAVAEHNKGPNDKLHLVAILKGESQVVAGTNYRLVIAAAHYDDVRNYTAVVWSRPWLKSLELVSFEQNR